MWSCKARAFSLVGKIEKCYSVGGYLFTSRFVDSKSSIAVIKRFPHITDVVERLNMGYCTLFT